MLLTKSASFTTASTVTKLLSNTIGAFEAELTTVTTDGIVSTRFEVASTNSDMLWTNWAFLRPMLTQCRPFLTRLGPNSRAGN